MQRQAGFTLVELIAVTVLLGIVAIFGGIFLSTGMRGALNSRLSAESGQKAQIALDRIALELREAEKGAGAGNAIQVLANPARIVYITSHASLPGTRTLQYNTSGTNAGTLTLTTLISGVTSTNVLVDEVTSCSMGFSGTTSTTVFTVSFTLGNSGGTFSITAKPRNAIATPVTS